MITDYLEREPPAKRSIHYSSSNPHGIFGIRAAKYNDYGHADRARSRQRRLEEETSLLQAAINPVRQISEKVDLEALKKASVNRGQRKVTTTLEYARAVIQNYDRAGQEHANYAGQHLDHFIAETKNNERAHGDPWQRAEFYGLKEELEAKAGRKYPLAKQLKRLKTLVGACPNKMKHYTSFLALGRVVALEAKDPIEFTRSELLPVLKKLEAKIKSKAIPVSKNQSHVDMLKAQLLAEASRIPEAREHIRKVIKRSKSEKLVEELKALDSELKRIMQSQQLSNVQAGRFSKRKRPHLVTGGFLGNPQRQSFNSVPA